ncbi:hypothetical protein XBLMG947_3868 [Xanthomonas bromi]|uniref:Uncharacterized protein n=1 Tax=Xanthomonas bromi TaxID=56449 RepID=A0A1C3NRP6_9XANT|nr:hypothetical protein [Xanthomonas bromi]PPV04899.1 hypothetical protein XbrCFBP1976_19885 [Xanthomonas bromi]SBV53065.1 hypothetical protein XBLMG947_3868 [Xanthomonas bromi]
MKIDPQSTVMSHADAGIDLEAGTSSSAAPAPISPSDQTVLSPLSRAPSRATPRLRADAAAADASARPSQTDTGMSSMLQHVGAYGGPVVDGAAAGLSLAAARLSAAPEAARLTGTLSGALWAGGAAINQLGNVPANRLVSAANVVGATAGVLSAVAPSLTGSDTTRVAYASAAAWAANGGANLLRAASDTTAALPSRVLQGISGAANVAAAGLAAAATVAAQQDEPLKAANLGTASSVVWGVGAVAALGSARTAAPRQTPTAADAVEVPPDSAV